MKLKESVLDPYILIPVMVAILLPDCEHQSWKDLALSLVGLGLGVVICQASLMSIRWVREKRESASVSEASFGHSVPQKRTAKLTRLQRLTILASDMTDDELRAFAFLDEKDEEQFVNDWQRNRVRRAEEEERTRLVARIRGTEP